MQPIDPAAKSPKVHEPALNHVGLWVDDLAAAVAWLGEHGVRFTPGGIRKGAAGYDVCFIHPKGNAEVADRRRGRADRARPGAARGAGGVSQGRAQRGRAVSRRRTESGTSAQRGRAVSRRRTESALRALTAMMLLVALACGEQKQPDRFAAPPERPLDAAEEGRFYAALESGSDALPALLDEVVRGPRRRNPLRARLVRTCAEPARARSA